MKRPRRGEKGEGPVLLGLRGYARHRQALGLRGVTLSAVQKAFADGRIRKSCKLHDRCPDGCESVDQGFNPEFADPDWEQTSSKPPDGEGGSLVDAQRIRTLLQARRLRLDLERTAGNLVPKADVEAERLLAAQTIQKTWMQFCRRVAPRLATMADPRAIQEYLEDEARRALSRAGIAIERAAR